PKGLACVGGICRVHHSLRTDPFGALTGAFVGKPKPIGIRCRACRQPIRRAYTPAELTGWSLSYYCCACTLLSQLAQLADPTLKDWSRVVARAKALEPGAIVLQAALVQEASDAGGEN